MHAKIRKIHTFIFHHKSEIHTFMLHWRLRITDVLNWFRWNLNFREERVRDMENNFITEIMAKIMAYRILKFQWKHISRLKLWNSHCWIFLPCWSNPIISSPTCLSNGSAKKSIPWISLKISKIWKNDNTENSCVLNWIKLQFLDYYKTWQLAKNFGTILHWSQLQTNACMC